ncbi:hypothetical protein ACFQS1_25155 [Paractinoplanes rhizophilus]|uniref:Uncharacterized protein n=1 Tax=Paractinoplanes rhizophilus TaxID=1416877 RepID=A0ABW2HWM9_9ACTN
MPDIDAWATEMVSSWYGPGAATAIVVRGRLCLDDDFRRAFRDL